MPRILLRPALTSQRVESRANGTKLLADVLHAAHPLHLQPIEGVTPLIDQSIAIYLLLVVFLVNLLVEFFCNRLNDRHIVVPHVLSGFLAIVQYFRERVFDCRSDILCQAMYHKLAEGQAKTICHEIFREVQMQVCKLAHLSLSLPNFGTR